MDELLIAPCGMNCGICAAYLRKKNNCLGCHSIETRCVIVKCEIRKLTESGFCYECEKAPCRRLRQLDKRYRTNYGMSMIENLEIIREHGMDELLEREEKKWRCPECGGIISCHLGFCYSCAMEKREKRKRGKDATKAEWELIAPCGMNCGVCSRYLAKKYDVQKQGIKMGYCPGCRPRDKQCSFIQKGCQLLASGELEFCHECGEFPCRRLLHIDKRYRTRYRMSMIENLEYIRDNGMAAFLEKEQEKWRCPECGGVISCHNGICYSCGLEKLKSKKYKYRWEN